MLVEVLDASGKWVLPVEMKQPGSITLSMPVMANAKEVVSSPAKKHTKKVASPCCCWIVTNAPAILMLGWAGFGLAWVTIFATDAAQ